MRTTAVTAVFGLLIVAAFAVGGKEPVPAARVAEGAPDPATKKLIDDLGSDDWRAREKAGRDLAAKGEVALPHLRKALLATDSPEVQRRLSVLVRKMDYDRLVEPKRVTLSAKNRTAKQVFEDIAKQTGYRIDYGDQTDFKHSFEFNNTPFWQAVDAVANAAGATVYPDSDDDTVRVYNQDVVNPHVGYSGPFRLLATNINSNRSVQLSGISKQGETQRASEYMNLSFQVQSEPKNPMLGLLQPELTEAKDDLGGSLLPPQERNNFRSSHYMGGNSRGHGMYMSVNLNRGDRAATSIKSLKGRVAVMLLSGTVPELTVADLLKVKKKSFVGRSMELEIESTDEDANQKGVYVVTLTAKRPPANADPNDRYSWSQNVWQRLEVFDEKGNKYFCYGPTVFNNNNGESVRLAIQFGPDDRRTGRPAANKVGPPAKLVLNEWVSVTQEITFAFKDIPLP